MEYATLNFYDDMCHALTNIRDLRVYLVTAIGRTSTVNPVPLGPLNEKRKFTLPVVTGEARVTMTMAVIRKPVETNKTMDGSKTYLRF